ncbi:MAG: hypothetical protein IJA31_13150 [Clostridia bacterium]|nr:hypothetical protein [Clostridia bacterium]
MGNIFKVCASACGLFSLMGMYDLHLQNEENEPHSENDKNDRHSQTLVAQPSRNDNHIRHFEMI